jgi:hypothetical protein
LGRLEQRGAIVAEQAEVVGGKPCGLEGLRFTRRDPQLVLHALERGARVLVSLSRRGVCRVLSEHLALVDDLLLEPVASQPAGGAIPELPLASDERPRAERVDLPARLARELACDEVFEQLVPPRLCPVELVFERGALDGDLIRASDLPRNPVAQDPYAVELGSDAIERQFEVLPLRGVGVVDERDPWRRRDSVRSVGQLVLVRDQLPLAPFCRLEARYLGGLERL